LETFNKIQYLYVVRTNTPGNFMALKVVTGKFTVLSNKENETTCTNIKTVNCRFIPVAISFSGSGLGKYISWHRAQLKTKQTC